MWIIAKNTFTETIRDRILYSVVIFALVILIAALLVSEISMNNDLKIVTDLGLSSISIFGTIITLFIGTKLIFSEINQRTILIVLSKPVKRSNFIIGKWLGLCGVIAITTSLFAIFFACILFLVNGALSFTHLEVIFLSVMEQTILVALALFFSIITSAPIIALFATLAVFVAGHITESSYVFAINSDNTMFLKITNIIYHIIPNLEYFNLKPQAMTNFIIGFEQWGYLFLYTSAWISLLLYSSIISFKRQEF